MEKIKIAASVLYMLMTVVFIIGVMIYAIS